MTCRGSKYMNAEPIIAALDAEIEKLYRVRALLGNHEGLTSGIRQAIKPPKAAKRALSPESRKLIADAQRKRWAATKRQNKSASIPKPGAPNNMHRDDLRVQDLRGRIIVSACGTLAWFWLLLPFSVLLRSRRSPLRPVR
jgi:hypothetical protein